MAGSTVAVAYHRVAVVRSFFTLLSVAALVVPGVFLLRPGVWSLVGGQTGDAGSGEVSGASGGAPSTTPVVLVIFDELPLLSLLDAERKIDPVLYPNFSALERNGVWFRNATTVNDFTRWAVPSIVSGNYPRKEALPAAFDHPDTLFTLLSPTHRLEVSESVTFLCPLRLCPADEATSHFSRLAAISRDLRIVFLRFVLTEDLTAGLPDPTETWAGFGDGTELPLNPEEAAGPASYENIKGADRPMTEAARRRWQEGITASRGAPVRRFIDGISADDPQPTFYFLHTLVSHHPFSMLPDGRESEPQVGLPGKVGGSWDKEQPWAVAQQYQRHLLQVGFVDRLVGQLVKRPKDADLYERAMVVITADHGISHVPGTPERNLIGPNAAVIMRVPLIVKYSEGIKASRGVSDVNAETVDILPTVADALDVEVPWQTDGTSLLDPLRLNRPSKAMFSGGTGRRRDLDPHGPNMGSALRRKLDLFGDGARNAHRAPRLPEYDGLMGRALDELRLTDGGGAVEVTYAREFDNVDLPASAAVFDVSGRFGSPRPDTFVAVAVNGVVEAVTRTWESNARGWLATPRFDAWREGRNRIDVFVIDSDGDGPLLRRASQAQVRPADLNLISEAAALDWGVGQWGFYDIEATADGKPFRWMRDQAELWNLFTYEPPRGVEIDVIMVPGGGGPKALKIEANGCTLFEGDVSGEWSSTFSFERCDLSGGDITLRFATDAPRGEKDRRRLSVALSRVVLH